MSKQQWGHGYYKGFEAGKQAEFEPCFIISYDEYGSIVDVFRAVKKSIDGQYCGDWFGYIDTRVCSYDLNIAAEDIDPRYYEQRDYDRPEYLAEHGFATVEKLYTWAGVRSRIEADELKFMPF